MNGGSRIDTTFDVRNDAGGKDPDSHSKTLRGYHRLLWSKLLPNGVAFDLDDTVHHQSDLGEFWLSSDAITHTYSNWSRPSRLVQIVREVPPSGMAAFYDLGCTVGAYLVFPTPVYVDGKRCLSINQARGIHPRIRDRFDLTLECIRRYYAGTDSPLTSALGHYAAFGSFAGYVDHFLLNDLVTDDLASVRFLKDFDDFESDPLPSASFVEYSEYMDRSMAFITSRNERIAEYASTPDARASMPDR